MTARAAVVAPASDSPPEEPSSSGQRARILQTALRLMGDQGAQNTSMRQLAAACSLNVATLYHYFPSKASILDAVIADKRYVEQLRDNPVPIDVTLAPRERLTTLMRTMFEGTLAEEATMRLVIGESLRGEPVAVDAISTLSVAIEETLHQWLVASFPELDNEPRVVARVLRDQLFSFCVEAMSTRSGHDPARLRERADDVAGLVFR